MPIGEDHPQNPINPYGASKLMVERMLADFGAAYNLRTVSLRYFNAAGADPDGEIGEDHDPETHLIPLVLKAAAGELPNITIYGSDYDTPDGTCIRDYVHVTDLAEAHVLALRALQEGINPSSYNLGNGHGFSVREVIRAARAVTGRTIEAIEGCRRLGDPARLVSDAKRAKFELGWNPQYGDLRQIIATAWNWT
jgi:UDP-glucose-4-epimerase GalE